jgi:hypothetical protein
MKTIILKGWKITLLGAVCALSLLAGQAWAVIPLMTSNINPQSSPALPNVSLLDLSGAAGSQTTLAFSTATATRIRIIFNAECAVGGAVTNWLNIDIIIDPAGAGLPFVATPSNSDNAFCSGNGTASNNDGWVSATTQAFASVPAGVHTIQVRANGVGVGATWRIDDLSLVIDTQ